jgi:hypothetical protein
MHINEVSIEKLSEHKCLFNEIIQVDLLPSIQLSHAPISPPLEIELDTDPLPTILVLDHKLRFIQHIIEDSVGYGLY